MNSLIHKNRGAGYRAQDALVNGRIHRESVKSERGIPLAGLVACLALLLAGCSSLPISFSAERQPGGGYAIGIRGSFTFSDTRRGGENPPRGGVLAPWTRDLGETWQGEAFKGLLKAYRAATSDGKTMEETR